MIFRYLWFLLIPILVFPQVSSNNVEEYELLLSEVRLLMQYIPPISEDQALIDSAESAAKKNEYTLASVYLEVALDELYAKSNLTSNESIKNVYNQSQRMEIKIKSGLDFNRQEFEIGYVESDSVILNEVNKPFIGINLNYLISGTKQHGLSTDLYLRADNENIEGGFRISNPYKTKKFYGYNALELDIDHNSLNPDIGYWEIASQQSLNYKMMKWYFQIENNFRFKNYKEPSQTIPAFVKNIANFVILYEHDLLTNTRLFYQVDFNESIDYKNNDFFEQNAGLSFINWFPGPVNNEIKMDYINNDFTYTIEDSVFYNISRTATALLDIRAPLFNKYYWAVDYLYKYKTYQNKSEQDPDYWEQELNTSIQKEIIGNLNLSLGYHFQRREHKLFSGSDAIYVTEQNYNDHGILGELSYHRAANLFFTGMITYSRRKYPESESLSTLSFYKSKNILNLFLLIQAPIYKNLYMNLFLSYDNDEELDNDRNDTRSTIFSFELEYNF
jgi:hypothetical protein